MKKKSYNPFEMWGSYVGGLVGWFSSSIINNMKYMEEFCPDTANIVDCASPLGAPAGIMLFVYIIVGFFIGWGVHSLFRKFKK